MDAWHGEGGRRGGATVTDDNVARRRLGAASPTVPPLPEPLKPKGRHAGSAWHDSGRIFTQPNGKALDPRRDYAEWQKLLAEAGVTEARLHDARHTAATVLLILGIPGRAVMAIMGWSTVAMKQHYMHVTETVRRDVAEHLNAYCWEA